MFLKSSQSVHILETDFQHLDTQLCSHKVKSINPCEQNQKNQKQTFEILKLSNNIFQCFEFFQAVSIILHTITIIFSQNALKKLIKFERKNYILLLSPASHTLLKVLIFFRTMTKWRQLYIFLLTKVQSLSYKSFYIIFNTKFSK